MTNDARRMYGGRDHLAPYPVGVHFFSCERTEAMLEWPSRQFPIEVIRGIARLMAPALLGDADGDRSQLRASADPRLHDIIDQAEPVRAPSSWVYAFRGSTPPQGRK